MSTDNSITFWKEGSTNPRIGSWSNDNNPVTSLIVHCDISKVMKDCEENLGFHIVGIKINPDNLVNVEVIVESKGRKGMRL